MWHNARSVGMSTVSTISAIDLLYFDAATVEAHLRGLVPDVATSGEIIGVTTRSKATLAVLERDAVGAAVEHFSRAKRRASG